MAVTDAPANCFVPELLELYPGAKVVTVTRDRARWWASWGAIQDAAGAGFLAVVLAVVPGRRWYPKLVVQFLDQYVFSHSPRLLSSRD